MNSKTIHLLVTGDYWHADFAEVFSKIESPVTMVPVERLDSIPPADYDVIVLAESRRDQFSQSLIDSLRANMPSVSIVVLLGSWCEGQNRSGEPPQGVNHVLWHQWQNRFESFVKQIRTGSKSDWQQPLTATVADRVRDLKLDAASQDLIAGTQILISSLHKASFEALSDALRLSQCDCVWFESTDAANGLKDDEFDLICFDGDTVTDDFRMRIESVSKLSGETPAIAIVNCPRRQDVASLKSIGVYEFLAKPFDLQDLIRAISRVVSQRNASLDIVPKPQMLNRDASVDRKRS